MRHAPVWEAATNSYMRWWQKKLNDWANGTLDVEPSRMADDRSFIAGFRAGVKFEQGRRRRETTDA
jgi:hypothetical protein